MGDTTLSDERRRILRRVKRHLVRDMDAEEVLLRMTAENIFNTTEEERIKVKLTRSEKNEQLLDILPSKGEKAYKIFKETLQEVHPHLANIILELVEKEMGTMETGGASDTTLDKPLSDERRRILRRVKRDLVRDMDANEVLLQMTAENIFNTTEEERIKVKPTRSEQNKQLLDILPTKGEKAYEIFKETLQEVHPPLANIILEREKKDLESEEQAERARQAPDSKTTSIPQEIKNSIIHEFLVSEEGFTEDCTILTHLNQTEGRSPVIFREIPQFNEEPPICEPSTSVESPVDDSAQIEKLRKSVVTQRIATLFKEDIGNCWSDLGPFLEVRESEIRNIDKDYHKARDKGFAVLQSWRDKKGRRATVGRLESVLTARGMKRIAEKLLEIVREENRGESKYHETYSSEEEVFPWLLWGETWQHQASEREGSPKTMPSDAKEVYVSKTRDVKQSGRRDEAGSEQRKLEKAVGGYKLEETKEERGKTKEELLLKKEKAARKKGTSRKELRRAER